MWSRCGLGECGTTCVSPAVDGGLASRDEVTLQLHDDSCLCHVRGGIFIPRNWQLRNTVIHRATCSQACCDVRNKVYGTCSRRMSEAPSSRGGVRFMLFYIVLSAFVNMRIKSDSVVVFINKSFRQSLHDSVYCSILLLFNLWSFSNLLLYLQVPLFNTDTNILVAWCIYLFYFFLTLDANPTFEFTSYTI